MVEKLCVLEISSSGRKAGSVSRLLSQEVVQLIQKTANKFELLNRDLSDGVEWLDEEWILANFTPDHERTTDQHARLRSSDRLLEELQRADIIVIGAPIYNFGIPASLKAWVDMIARARKSFRYTESGPEGLLKGKKAFLVMASGGVAVDSATDFATPYLRQALKFVGITDVEVIAADRLNHDADASLQSARARIAELFPENRSLRGLAA